MEFGDGRLEGTGESEVDANDATNRLELVHSVLDGALDENGAANKLELVHSVLDGALDENGAANRLELVHPVFGGVLDENGEDKSAERLHPIFSVVFFLRGSRVEEPTFFIGVARGVCSGCELCPWFLLVLSVFLSQYNLQPRPAWETKSSGFFMPIVSLLKVD